MTRLLLACLASLSLAASLALFPGCRNEALPVCSCPTPDGGAPAQPDLSATPDLAAPPDLSTVIDLANADAQQRPEIFEVLPNTPMRIGDTVKILGRDLGCVRSYCSLQLGASYLNPIPGADESTISFVVPQMTLGANGAYVDLQIFNSAGSDKKPVTVLPLPVTPAGSLDILWRAVDRAALDLGQPTLFHFTVRSNANQPLPVVLTATTTNNTVFPYLADSAFGQALAPGASRDFTVSLNPASGNAPLSLYLHASAGAVSGFFAATDLQVAAPIPPQDFDLDLHGQVYNARSAIDDLVAVDTRGAQVRIFGELRSAHSWTIEAQLSSADWKLQWLEVEPVQFTATPAELTGAPVERAASLLVTPAVPNPQAAFLTVTAAQPAASTQRKLRYRLLTAE